jgi:hypothetical protein
MAKLLHLVFAVWKTNRPFDAQHFPWEQVENQAASQPTASPAQAATPASMNDKAVGHKRDEPAQEVVTTATPTVDPASTPVNPLSPTPAGVRPALDFAFLRQQVTMQQVLEHLGLWDQLRGRGYQRRGPCPVHNHSTARERTFSVHLGKNIFQCFHPDCGAHGNVLDLWAAIQRLPLYEAGLHLVETFHLAPNREEETVEGTRASRPAATSLGTRRNQ